MKLVYKKLQCVRETMTANDFSEISHATAVTQESHTIREKQCLFTLTVMFYNLLVISFVLMNRADTAYTLCMQMTLNGNRD